MTGLVIDASALSEHLVGSSRGAAIAAYVAAHAADGLHLPHLAIIETTSVLRGWVRGSQLTAVRARAALGDLADYPATRWPAEPFLPRTWELRDNVTPYDAAYVALAEALDGTLLTCDRRLQRAVRRTARCTVVVID